MRFLLASAVEASVLAAVAMMKRSRQTLEDVEVELLDDVNEVLGLAAG